MGKPILLVEDNIDWRQMAVAALEQAGYSMIAVSGAAEALLQSEDRHFALIILDLDLGGENGLMLMKHLKRHHPDSPILICTGMEPSDPAIARMRELGAAYFLKKGTMQELVTTVHQATRGESGKTHAATPPRHS
jgi:DNA-binding NtrC family response regulator